MSVVIPSIRDMEMTAVQRRTLEGLIGTGERPIFPPDLGDRLRDRIEGAVRGLELPGPLWVSKDRLNDLARCEGKFQAGVLGEAPPFAHSRKSAAGTLVHKAIELDIGGRDEDDPHALSVRAAARLVQDDRAFGGFWRELDRGEQDETIMAAVRRLTHFRGSFPSLRQLRTKLAPIPEFRVRSELLGGAVVLSGQVDLLLGRPDPLAPGRATRLVIDLKNAGAWPEYPEDMRFYALLLTLRFGVPPYRVASLFLESGEWQSEDVTEDALRHAADRVIGAARAAAGLSAGRDPALTPGRHCAWCPRSTTCPASLALTG
jgi:hypothetical protein